MINFSITEFTNAKGIAHLRADFTDGKGRARHLDQCIEAVASGRRTARERLVRPITEAYGATSRTLSALSRRCPGAVSA
ncbi:MAG: hypothetical protein OXF88_21840 [Rhodobacteraceae bacterium]|nr:hypothetical protein [Paracoccaceae bacterium]MCY4137252.1 hypothetical protein [Paracoccaceae bacterium]